MKKTIALLLSALLCLSVVPTYALEQNGDTAQIQSGKKDLETVKLSDSAVSDALKKTAEEVQGLINSLPALDEVKAMTNEEQQSAYMEIQKAYEAYEALTEEEKTGITGAEVLSVLLTFFTEGVSSLIDKDFEVTGNNYNYSDDGVLTVNNGANLTISMKTGVTDTTNRIVISENAEAKITLNGIKIKNLSGTAPAIDVKNKAKLTLILPYNEDKQIENELIGANNGYVNVSAGISVPDGATLNIVCGEHSNGSGSCNEKCGLLKATGEEACAGIGGESKVTAGKINISGGVVNAEGGGHAAGIGGGWRGAGGDIIISGGVVNATGGMNGAGIGGGSDVPNGNAGNITIKGGKVTAKGGFTAAAIGGGYNGNGGNITITGGEVDATGGYGGAGIGGSDGGNSGDIVISGGTVTAKSAGGGAGIGAGRLGNGETIIITGGKVTANGSVGSSMYGDFYGGAGIGGGGCYTSGQKGACGTVIVLGGEVNATGGSCDACSAEPIGPGFANDKKGDSGNGIKPVPDENNTYEVWGDLKLPTSPNEYTIPKGTTLKIPQVASLTIPNGTTLTIPEGATLTNYGKIQTECTGQLIVKGKYVEIMGDLKVEPNNGRFGLCEYDDTQRVITVKDGADITVSMVNPAAHDIPDHIVVEKGTADITLDRVHIQSNDSPIDLKPGANLTLWLSSDEDNVLRSVGQNKAGIHVAKIDGGENSTLNIKCKEHPDGNCISYRCGELSVHGGKDAAGIGSNGVSNEKGGNITISGGTDLDARGDNDSHEPSAAGIGGGKGNSGGNITITGGEIVPTVLRIGNGQDGSGGTITISGGMVNAPFAHLDGAFSTGTNGNAVIIAKTIGDHSQKESWSGVIYENSKGEVYGTTVAPKLSFYNPVNQHLEIKEGKTLIVREGLTFENYDTVTGAGCLIGGGEFKRAQGTSDFPKDSKITLEFDKKKYQYNDTVTITAKISPADTTRISTASARESQLNENEIVFYVGTGTNKREFKRESITIDSTTKEIKIELSAEKGFAPGDNTISAEYGGGIGFNDSSLGDIHINLQEESNPSDDTAGNVTNPFINGNVFFPSAPTVSTSNSNTITPNAVTTGDQSAENVNAFVFADDNKESSTTYSESNNPAESGGEQNSDAETNAVINKNDLDLPPKTGNGGSVTIFAIALVSFVGIGGISLYNKKKKR